MVRYSTLLIVPFLVALSAGALLRLIAPIYAGLAPFDYDPAYVYLFNGLGIVEGYVPRHTDHPGTPLQALIGLIVLLTHAAMRFGGSATGDIGASVMAAPETYLAVTSAVMLALSAVAIFYLGLRILRATGRIELALTGQAGFLLLGSLTPHLAFVSAEALVIFTTVMTAACLTDLLLRPVPLDRRELRATVIGSAFFIALGLTTKVTCLPLLLLPLLLPARRDVAVCFALIAGFALLMLLPILSELPQVMEWFISILTHSGRYGAGEAGFVDATTIPERFYRLVAANGFLFATAVLLALAGLVTLLRRPDAERSTTLRTIAVFLGIGAIQLLMTLKHFGLHYMLPTFCIYSIAFVYALTLLVPRDTSEKALRRLAGFAFGTALIVGAVQGSRFYETSRIEAQARDAAVAGIERTIARHPGALVVGAFRSRDQRFAIQFAFEFLAPDLVAQLAKLQPNAIAYDRWQEVLMFPGGATRRLDHLNEVIAKGRTVLFVVPGDLDLPKLIGERLIQVPGRETVFRVTRIDSGASASNESRPPREAADGMTDQN